MKRMQLGQAVSCRGRNWTRVLRCGALALAPIVLSAVQAQGQSGATDEACANLAKMSLPHSTITLAKAVAPGEFKVPAQQGMGMGGPPQGGQGGPGGAQGAPGGAQRPQAGPDGAGVQGGAGGPGGPGGGPRAGGPGGPGGGPPATDTSKMPKFCRVAATIKPTADSDIKMEVWMPVSGWNGKFYAVGNSGWAGSIPYRGMVEGLEANYAVAGTDTGHDVGNGSFIPGHPEKFIDYGYRGDHEMTLRSKEVIKAYLKSDPKFSYWIGCSLGGMEALVEADRYPKDYNAIIAGAPMNPMTMFNAEQIWNGWLALKFPDKTIPAAKFGVMHEAIMKACATPIGQKQGFIEDPGSCKWDPAVLQCKNGDAPDCLTAAQVETARKIYEGPVNPRTGEHIFPGIPLGLEAEMSQRGMGGEAKIATDLYRYAVYQDPNWDWTTMDYDKSITKAREVVDPVMRAGTNLNAFLNNGGKLLLHGGWAEMRNGSELADYYKQVLKNAGPGKEDQVKLFLIPGMGHCGGGNGPNQFDKLTTLDSWVQTGEAPTKIIMSKMAGGQVTRTRPTCAFPAVAKYKGSGSEDDASSYTCSQ